MTRIIIIAGETSGDEYGAKLMQALNAKYNNQVEFWGIGGPEMMGSGLNQLEDINNVSVVGFSEAVKKARAEAEGAHLRNIRRAADNGTWQASAWWLERSFPKKWGKRSTLDLSDGNEEIQFQIEYGD